MLLLGDLLRRNALVRPDKTAIIFEETRLTYRELNDAVNQFANALMEMGVKRGDRVGLLIENSHHFPIVYFASIKIGAILVPVSFWYRGNEITYAVNKAGISLLILGQKFTDTIKSIQNDLTTVSKYIVIGQDNTSGMVDFEALMASSPTKEPQTEVHENDPHLILFTSGTTGAPKGAVITQRTYFLHTGITVNYFGLKENHVNMNVYPMFHMGGPVAVLNSVYAGCPLVIISTPPTPKKILDAIQEHKVTHFIAVPTLWKRLLEYPDFDSYDLSSLKVAMGGSDAMPKELLEEILRRTNVASPQIYGLTEGGVLTFLDTEDSRRKIGSSGKPHCQAEIKLVDEEGRDVHQGEVGEIICRGEHQMAGYWDMPEETKKAVRDGWLYTGDLGKIDEEGHLYIVGRKKDMIISGGQNIYPADVERLLINHPKIEEIAIIGIPDKEWGESVVAVAALKKGQAMSEEELVSYVKDNMASYNKPRHVRFVEALPRTAATGKVQKAELRKQYAKEVSLKS